MVDDETESVEFLPENFRRDTLEESVRALLQSYNAAVGKISEQGAQLNALRREFDEELDREREHARDAAFDEARLQIEDLTRQLQAAHIALAVQENGVTFQ